MAVLGLGIQVDASVFASWSIIRSAVGDTLEGSWTSSSRRRIALVGQSDTGLAEFKGPSSTFPENYFIRSRVL